MTFLSEILIRREKNERLNERNIFLHDKGLSRQQRFDSTRSFEWSIVLAGKLLAVKTIQVSMKQRLEAAEKKRNEKNFQRKFVKTPRKVFSSLQKKFERRFVELKWRRSSQQVYQRSICLVRRIINKVFCRCVAKKVRFSPRKTRIDPEIFLPVKFVWSRKNFSSF